MVRLFPAETFKEMTVGEPLRKRYAVSNYGRLMSFKHSTEDGVILKGGKADGYSVMRYKKRIDGKDVNRHVFLYKVIADLFIPKPSEEHLHVLHLDRKRDNDHTSNLKWATREEWLDHNRKSPHVLAARKRLIEHNLRSDGAKLTVTQVMLIKKRLLDPNRKTRIKILAKQFGVSEMQMHRIKTGENWGHIKVS